MASVGGSDRVDEVLEEIVAMGPEEREELRVRLEERLEKEDMVLSSSMVLLRDDAPDEDYVDLA